MMLKILYIFFVFLRGFFRIEGAEVFALVGFGIDFFGVDPVLP